MLSNHIPLHDEINLLKRKADSEDKCASSLPPSKLPKLESEVEISKGHTEDLDQEFNTFLYWKDPLPDVEAELSKIPCQMICD